MKFNLNLVRLRLNRSGMSFFLLLPMVLIFLFTMLFLVVNSHEGSIYDKSFTMTKSVDILASNLVNHKLYLDILVKNELESSGKNFLSSMGDKSKLLGLSIDESKFESCFYESELVLYNEAYLDFQESELVEESDLVSCFPEFVVDFVSDYESFISSTLNTKLDEYFNFGTLSLEEIDIKIEDSQIIGSVKYDEKMYSELGAINLESVVDFNYSISKLPDLVLSFNSILPGLSDRIKLEISTCKKLDIVSDDIELYCIRNSFLSAIEDFDESILMNYDFELSRVYNSDVDKYYGIRVKVFDKSFKPFKNIFNFIFVLKNNLPYGEISYTLSNYDFFDNIISLNLVKPNLETGSLAGYVILYSYEDFFNPSSSSYSNLISLLENSKIPSGFDDLGVDFNSNRYLSPSNDLGVDVSLLFVSAGDDVDINKIVKVHQIYNRETNSFELLSERPVHFAVFAVDNRYNYFTDPELLNSVYKKITPEKKIGPIPIKKSQLKVNGDISGMDRAFEFELVGYDTNLISNFELIIAKNRSSDSWSSDCLGVKYKCFSKRFSFSNEGSSLSNKFLVYSDFIPTEFDTSRYLDTIKSDFDLGDGSKFEFIVVPVDSNAVGSYSDVVLSENTEQKDNYFLFKENGVGLNSPLLSFRTSIKDNRAPLFSEINILSDVLNNEAGNLFLQWSSNPGSDVKSVVVSIVGFNELNVPILTRNFEYILGSNVGFFIGDDINSVVIDKVYPRDYNGNVVYTNIALAPSNVRITYGSS